MTDLGFGLVDKRSVLIVLFTLGLANLVFGYPVPVDTSNALSAFLGLVLLTGFIYGIRTMLRLGLLAIFFIIRIPYDIVENFKRLRYKMRGIRGIVLIIAYSFSHSFSQGFSYPAFVRRDWQFQQYTEYMGKEISRKYGLLGALDRMLLVGVAFTATTPLLTGYVQIWGVIGILILIFLYIVTGSFSLVLDDAMKKADLERQRQHEEMVSAAGNPNISFPSVVTTKPYTYDP